LYSAARAGRPLQLASAAGLRWRVVDLANVLGVCPQSLTIPDIDTYIGVAHTLFTLEDLYGFKINNLDGELCLTLDKLRTEKVPV
jgi:hypothetical protein